MTEHLDGSCGVAIVSTTRIPPSGSIYPYAGGGGGGEASVSREHRV